MTTFELLTAAAEHGAVVKIPYGSDPVRLGVTMAEAARALDAMVNGPVPEPRHAAVIELADTLRGLELDPTRYLRRLAHDYPEAFA